MACADLIFFIDNIQEMRIDLYSFADIYLMIGFCIDYL